MTAPDTLATLLEHYRRDRDDALAAHRRAQVASEAAVAQCAQLRDYRRAYEQRWTGRFRAAATAELLGCYQTFVQRLSAAVEQQQAAADHALAQLAQRCAELRGAELRCASVEKLIARRIAEHRALADRQDQKAADEAAARRAWTRIGTTRPAPFA